MSDQPDAGGLWFRREPCDNCNGTGHAMCAASGCGRFASRVVFVGSGSSHSVRSCCDYPPCARETVDLLLREQMR